MIDMMLAERKRVADELLNCVKALQKLVVALDVTDNQSEREALRDAFAGGEAEIKSLKEKLLLIDLSISARKSKFND